MFPDRCALLEFIDNSSARAESLCAVSASDTHEERGFTDRNKAEPMMNRNLRQLKSLLHLLRQHPQLMFSHRPVRFVINPANRGATGDGLAEFMLGLAANGTIGNENGENDQASGSAGCTSP